MCSIVCASALPMICMSWQPKLIDLSALAETSSNTNAQHGRARAGEGGGISWLATLVRE